MMTNQAQHIERPQTGEHVSQGDTGMDTPTTDQTHANHPMHSPLTAQAVLTLQRTMGNGFTRGILQRQQAGHTADTLQRTLETYPEAERTAVQVSARPVDTAMVNVFAPFFTTAPSQPGWNGPSAIHSGLTLDIDSAIPANSPAGIPMRAGLDAVVHTISNSSPVVLAQNTMITIRLETAGIIARFTRLNHAGPPAGTPRVAPPPVDTVVIDQVGSIPAPVAAVPGTGATAGTTPTPPQSAQAQAGQAIWTAQGCQWGGTWQPADQNAVLEGLSQVPQGVLAQGLTFRRGTVHPTEPAEAGEFDTANNRITLFNIAFASSATQFGLSTVLTQTIAHEIGHAADLPTLDQALAAFNASQQTAANRRTLLAARSRSGSRWQADPADPTMLESAENPTDMAPAFRHAAQRDGMAVLPPTPAGGTAPTTAAGTPATLSGAPTSYGNTNWGEAFAESFSLFIADPDALRLTRPHIYDYMVVQFPAAGRAARPAPAPRGAASTRRR